MISNLIKRVCNFLNFMDKKKYSYVWQVEKILYDGELKNCWMTTSVSSPSYLGDII